MVIIIIYVGPHQGYTHSTPAPSSPPLRVTVFIWVFSIEPIGMEADCFRYGKSSIIDLTMVIPVRLTAFAQGDCLP